MKLKGLIDYDSSNNKIPLNEIKYNENINDQLEDIINEINFSC